MRPEDLTVLYETGIRHFNAGRYFEAHEVWEEAWRAAPAAERRFFQALIQAAVAVYHWNRGNSTGAARLYRSGRRYMDPYRPHHRGLDVEAFWQGLAAYLAPALTGSLTPLGPAPTIALAPPPGQT